MSARSNKPKNGAGHELTVVLLATVKALQAGTMSTHTAADIARSATVALRIELGHIAYARSRGEKPDLPFFENAD